jgi:hypothetical protein
VCPRPQRKDITITGSAAGRRIEGADIRIARVDEAASRGNTVTSRAEPPIGSKETSLNTTSNIASRRTLRWFLVLSVPFLLFFLSQIRSEGEAALADIRSRRTQDMPVPTGRAPAESTKKGILLERFYDPVLVLGEWLDGVVGTPLSAFRLVRYRNGGFEPIRFQLDERTLEGEWIFPHGKKNNLSESNGLLDGQDVLLFMARDAGKRAAEEAFPKGASSVSEIGLEDPVDGRMAWVYLAVYEGQPPSPSPLPDYVRYNYETEEVTTDFNYTKFIITEDGLHTGFSDIGAILPPAGGTGENRLDRMKTRIRIRFFFNLVPLSLNEENLGQDVAAYIQGPVRVIRRLEQFLQLPFGLRGMKSFADLHIYQNFVVVPAEIHVPKGVDKVISYSKVWFGADFAPNVIGSLFRNSENHEPLIIDGRMSEAERQFSSKQDRWRVFYGPTGAMFIRGVFPAEYAALAEIRQRYVDDLSVSHPPERYEGTIGLVQTELTSKNPQPGRYRIRMEVCFPPHYREGDETGCLNVGDNPLRVLVDGKKHINRIDLDGKPEEDLDTLKTQ